MFAVQLWLLAASKSTIRIKRHFPYNDVELLGLFFYLYILAFQLIALLVCQFEWSENPLYVETIGFSGVALEAAVPGFQVFRNFRNRSVKGFSELVLLVWFTGDICKIGYHLYFGNPIQFVLCGIVQVTFDLILFYQFYKYSKAFFDLNKEPDEQRRLLSEDPNEFYPNHNNQYYPSTSNQFEAKPSHQRFLTEGTYHENAYDEAVMDPKPKTLSKPIYEDPNSFISNKNTNHNKGKNLAIDIQDDGDYPSENESNNHKYNTSFNNSLSSFRSYQYANIRNSNYYLHHNSNYSNSGNNNNNNNNEQYDAINFILNLKNKVRSFSINNNSNVNGNGDDNNSSYHILNHKSSIATFSSHNSSVVSNEPSQYFDSNKSIIPESSLDRHHIIPSTIKKSLNRSKSVQFPHHPFNQINNNNNNNNSYHSTYTSLQRSNSQRNPVHYSRNQRTNNF